MMRVLLFCFLFKLNPLVINGQDSGFKIEVKIKNFPAEEVYLAYYYGDKTYIKDTAYKKNDRFIFSGSEKLPGGNYLIVAPPNDILFNVLMDENDQRFTIEAGYPVVLKDVTITGSKNNEAFFGYLNLLNKKRAEMELADKQLNDPDLQPLQKKEIELKKELINESVITAQKETIRAYPGSLLGAIIKATIPLKAPGFSGTKEEQQNKNYYWYRVHWFDNIELSDPGMLRTNLLHKQIEDYVEKLTSTHPDSVIVAVDKILAMVKPAPESFKFYLIYFLNKYAKSKLVGYDAVYVHLALKYYAKGKADWIEEYELNKILDNAKTLEPLLIGKKAPEIEMETLSGEKVSLYDFNADFTVLFFWDAECSHCRKSAPFIVNIAKMYKSRGVKIFSVCTITDVSEKGAARKGCGEKIKEYEFEGLFNTIDPFLRSKYKTLYDIRTTPQIYILDKYKKILSKKIGAEQLEEVLDILLK